MGSSQSSSEPRCVCRTRNGQLGCEMHKTGVFGPLYPVEPPTRADRVLGAMGEAVLWVLLKTRLLK